MTDRYCGATIGTRVAGNGAVAAEDFAVGSQGRRPEPRLVTIVDGVHSFVGGSIVNRTFIEGPDGVIVYDTGTHLADGERAAEALRSVTDKPVAAIVYSHNHYVHGARAFSSGDDGVPVIGHPRVNHNLAQGSDAIDFPEAAPVLAQRFRRQFASYLPAEGPDAPLGATYPAASKRGTLPVTRPVEDGEELTLAGLRVRFFTRHWSDSDDTLTMWVPDLGVALNNFLWPTIPNFYALRGTGFRDPRSWRDGVLQLRDLQPAYLVNTHAHHVTGTETVTRTLEGYADAIAYTYDQSMRGILQGLGPDELRGFVRLPDYLTELPNNRDGYGETQYQPPYLYERVFGWYDGRPEHINPAPRELESRRIVEGFGGPAKVRDAVGVALERQELSWAATLAGHLLDTSPDDPDLRALKAGTLRALGQRAGGSIARHFYLSYALELEGTATIPPSIPLTADQVERAPAAMYVDHLRVRLDPEKSGQTERMVAIRLTDASTYVGLHLRRAVCEFVADPARHPHRPHATVSLTHRTWAELFAGDRTWAGAIAEGLVEVEGDADEVIEFFGLFETQPTSAG